MPQVYDLDNVIRRINESEASKIRSSTAQKVIIIETQKGKVLARKPIFGGCVEFFLVSNSSNSSNIATSSLTFDIRDFYTDNRISVSVRYQVSCPNNNEEKVALALYEGNTPGVALENKITGWLHQYSQNEFTFKEFANNYNEQFEKLQKYAQAKAQSEIGLNLKLKLSLRQDDLKHLRTFPLQSTHFPISLRDDEQSLDFRFDTNLLISKNGEVNAILHFGDLHNLENILKEEISSYLRKNVSLFDFCYNFSNLQPNLVKHLNSVLTKYGREIDYFSHEIDKSILMPESFSIKRDINCELQDYSEPIVIKTTLKVEPQFENIVNYRKAKISNLQNWFVDNLDKIIQRKLFDCKYIEFLQNFKQIASAIEQNLEKEAKGIGYSIHLIAKISDEFKPVLKPFKVKSSYFSVLVNNYEQEINFRFETNLLISDNGESSAILNLGNLDKLEDAIKEETRKHLRDNVSLYDFCYEFSEKVQSNLVKHLDSILVKFGRKVEYFYSEIDKSILMPESLSIKHNTRCEIQEFPEPIFIKNTLEIAPNYEKIVGYKKAKISNLEAWFIKKLDNIVQRELFNVKYIDLLLDFSPRAEKIKDSLKKEAGDIGYSIRLITTVPDLKPLKLKDEGFNLKFDDTFAIKSHNNNVKVKLEFVVKGKIKDLEEIKDILNTKEDVDKLIERKIVGEVSTLLLEVEPENFYFNTEGKSVEDELRESITQLLKEEFHGTDIRVNLITLKTELEKRFNELKSQLCRFEIIINSLKDYKESVVYSGSFRVVSVAKDSWHIFQSHEHTIEEIKNYLQDHLRSRLKTFTSEKLKYRTPQQLIQAEENIKKLAQKAIIEQFGLVISISNLDRQNTELEDRKNKLYLESVKGKLSEVSELYNYVSILDGNKKQVFVEELESKRSELNEVRKKLLGISTREGNEDEVNSLKNKEASLKKEVNDLLDQQQKSSEKAKQQIQSLLPEVSDEEDEFDVFLSNNNSSLPSSNPQPKPQRKREQLHHNGEVIDVPSEEVDFWSEEVDG